MCPWNTGNHRMLFDGGNARVEPGDGSGARMTPTGLALVLAGGGVTAAAFATGWNADRRFAR
jgi:hypothetical protein